MVCKRAYRQNVFTLSKTAGLVLVVAVLEVDDEAEMVRDVVFEVIELAGDDDDEEPGAEV